MKHLESFLASIPAGQRDALLAMLDKQRARGEISSSEEYQKELEKLLPSVQRGKSFKPGFTAPYLDEVEPAVISSKLLNDAFKAIWLDLAGFYRQVNLADRTITVHGAARAADWSRIRDAINKLTEDLLRFRYLKLTRSWQDVKYQDFWANRVGEPTAQAAAIDTETKRLSLAAKNTRRIEQLRGPMQTLASVYEISASIANAASSDFKPESALDTSTKTFWGHLLLTDGPVTSTWDSVDYEGALVGYQVDFANAEFVNYLSFLPFGPFPLQLIDLQYRDGDTWDTVPGFSALESGVDWAEVRFERVQANAMRLILYQPSYVSNRYLVPRYAFNIAKLWDQVVNDELLMGVDEEDLTAAQQTSIETNPRFRAYLSALKAVETQMGQTGIVRGVMDDHENMGRALTAVTRVISEARREDGRILDNVISRETDADVEEDDDLLEVHKTEYMFGLRQVRIWHNDYMPIGVYRSPMFAVRAQPYEIALDVTESRLALRAPESALNTYYESSVEYEIELSPDRRVPILPDGTTTIQDEFLFIRPDTMTGDLRFSPATPGAVIGRASGKLLANGTDFSVAGSTVTILQGFSPNYRYTFTYAPSGTPELVDVDTLYNSAALQAPEVFTDTDSNGMVDLKYYPYVAYTIVNDDADWYMPDPEDARWIRRVAAGSTTIDGLTYAAGGSLVYAPVTALVDGVKAVNITDYRNREHPAFRSDPAAAGVFQFINSGKRLYFSRPLSGVTIEVLYRWMVQYIRLNITLRGHRPVVNPYTSVLSNYRVKVRTGR